MTRVLRSNIKKNQVKDGFVNELSIAKKSKTIKKTTSNSGQNDHNDIWNINSIFSNIFAFSDHKDLVNFNVICKKWNHLTNPIIHKSIKLQRRRAFQSKDHNKGLIKSAKLDAEAEMCIINNSKHAPFIKEFQFNDKLNPKRAMQFFETFRFISNLTIEGVSMTQYQFINIISPLNQLQELNIKCLIVRKVFNCNTAERPALPQSLTKLNLGTVYLYNNPELFIQTINSHRNLIELIF
jgi:hypothetical protein